MEIDKPDPEPYGFSYEYKDGEFKVKVCPPGYAIGYQFSYTVKNKLPRHPEKV